MSPVFAVIAGFAMLAALLAWSRWLARRRWAALGHLLLAVVATIVVVQGWPLATYLETYERRGAEQRVAELYFERTGPNRYRAAITRLPSGRMQVVELVGDEWRIELRALDVSRRASQLGLEPRYRIERLASQPSSGAAGTVTAGGSHALAASADPPWLAGFGARIGAPLTATRDLQGPWQPLAHGARFGVHLAADDAIEVDPLNAAAADSVGAPCRPVPCAARFRYTRGHSPDADASHVRLRRREQPPAP
jgi:hypothetical protein